MVETWELCRKLANSERRGLLRRVCEAADGLNVGIAVDSADGLKQAATSQYLGQLWRLGLIRRMRSGRFVNYTADAGNAPVTIRKIAVAIEERFRSESGSDSRDERFCAILGVMGNAMRAKLVGLIYGNGPVVKDYLCERTGLSIKSMMRHLKPAIDIGLVQSMDGDSFRLCLPEDPLSRLIIENN